MWFSVPRFEIVSYVMLCAMRLCPCRRVTVIAAPLLNNLFPGLGREVLELPNVIA
jgi:hypothetical protein